MRDYPEKLTDGYYYVRKTFEDTQSQLAKYRVLGNAKTKADENPGCFVFAEDGSCVYPMGNTETESDVTVKPEKPEADTASHTSEPEHYRLLSLMNVRTQPSLNAEKVGVLPEGTVVTVSSVEHDWLCLENGTFILYDGGRFAEKM